MRIHFWGVRGSLPAPQSSAAIRDKIAWVLERASPGDLESPERRERFLESLPPWVYGTVGGNTSCVSVRGAGGERVIFDAGSGIRELGTALAREQNRPSRYHLFFSHYHWDHLQGLPFFGPAYDPAVTMEFYSPLPDPEAALRGQMSPPFFPVGLEAMGSRKEFHPMRDPVTLGGLKISPKKMRHPGDSYAFLVEEGDRRFIYATDAELFPADFEKNRDNAAFFQDADLAVIDAQYTLEEAIDKYNWGHSAFSVAVDFAACWGIKHLVLFHHEPAYDDGKLFGILNAARGYRERMDISNLQLSLAAEGLELVL